jgi:SAM-dependent methyltransferase
MHFDGLARSYAGARPPYPTDLWRDVLATGLVAPGRRALDLGAGSGEATGRLLAHGMDVLAVEPGAQLAAVLEERFPRAVVVRSRAEDIHPEPASFDLVVAATSIHWMDLDVVLPIVHESLTANGRLLVWRNVFGDAAADVTPFRREVERIVQRRGTARSGWLEDVEETAEKVAESGLFSVDHTHRYRWVIELTTDQVRGLFSTFSDWTTSEVEEAASAVTGLGGVVAESYTSWLIAASPKR